MNRTTALLVALGALLAHTFAVYLGPRGALGETFDVAHVAYRIGRNLARGDGAAWIAGGGPGSGGLESYASPLWLGFCWLVERVHSSPVRWSQIACMASALLTVAISGRVAARRFVGIVPPVLLVLSGAWATAAGSGTEHATVALALTTAFVAGEHRRPLAFALGLALLAATRCEGLIAAAVLGPSYTLLPHLQRRAKPALPLVCLLPAALVFGLLMILRSSTGEPLAWALLAPLFTLERVPGGLLYLRDFATTSVLPILLFVPLVSLMAGRLSRAGARALLIALLWTTLVILSGGGPAPFGLAMVPALPLAAIAVEEGLLHVLDTHKQIIERCAWVLLIASTGLSLMFSRFPGDLGPLPLEKIQRSWTSLDRQPSYGYAQEIGRSALEDEIRIAERMRALALFLRDEVGGGYSILTPWPGALGYLSRMEVRDWFARTDQTGGLERTPPWASAPAPRIDLLGPVRQQPDFILPGVISARAAYLGNSVDRSLLQLDAQPSAARVSELLDLLEGYELVALPVQKAVRGTPQPFYLLRKRSLDWGPSIEMARENETVRVAIRMGSSRAEPRPGHRQLGTLEVEAIDDRGRSYWIDPTGQLRSEPVLARSELVLLPQGERPTELLCWRILDTPDGARIQSLQARILNPGVRRRHAISQVGATRSLELR